jgi:hypothetical protein
MILRSPKYTNMAKLKFVPFFQYAMDCALNIGSYECLIMLYSIWPSVPNYKSL